MSAAQDSDHDYVERLGAALRTRDSGVLRDFLVAQAGRFGDEAQVEQITRQSSLELEMLMHRMTLARSDLSEYHAASRSWLTERGVALPPIKPSRRN